MKAYKEECVAGFGHDHSLWFCFQQDRLIACKTITPSEGQITLFPNQWFMNHFLVVKTNETIRFKNKTVLPCLTFAAGERAVQAVREYNTRELAAALTTHYGWQLINGARVLPPCNELAKVHAGNYAVYLFRGPSEKTFAKQHQFAEPNLPFLCLQT